jgi:hypothetical protein
MLLVPSAAGVRQPAAEVICCESWMRVRDTSIYSIYKNR